MNGKLPVAGITKAAYTAVFDPFRSFLAATWAWMILGTVVTVAVSVLLSLGGRAGGLVADFLTLPVFAGAAVMWHRRIQLGERLQGLAALRFRRRELKFLALEIVLPLPLYLSLGIVFFVSLFGGAHWAAGISLTLVIAAVYASLRVLLALPLIAIDEAGALRKSWALMKGNLLRFILIAVLILLPVTLTEVWILSVFERVVAAALPDSAAWATLALFIGTSTALKIIGACLMAGALSFSLMHLRGIDITRRLL